MTKIILACSKAGVTELTMGDLSLKFDSTNHAHSKYAIGKEAIPTEQVQDMEVKNPSHSDPLFIEGDEDTERVQSELDDLLISDPDLYEQMIEEKLKGS